MVVHNQSEIPSGEQNGTTSFDGKKASIGQQQNANIPPVPTPLPSTAGTSAKPTTIKVHFLNI
jgi:hypothetical protein